MKTHAIDTNESATTHLQRMARWWPALVLAVLVAAVYWPGRNGGYIFDDFPNIVANTALHVTTLAWQDWLAAVFSSHASAVQRPLAMLSFAINHYFTGLDPVPMKVTGIAIHALNACLVLGLVRQLFRLAAADTGPVRREWTARFIAAAWALHPINLMPVLFIVQRMESLSHTFVFAGLWLYLAGRSRQLGGGNGWPSILAGLSLGTGLGVLAKESAILLPVYACLVELCVLKFRDRTGRTDRRLATLFAVGLSLPAVLGVAWLLPWLSSPTAYAGRDFTLGERLLTEGRVVLDYLRWTLLPDLGQLSLYHDDYPVSRGLLQPPATLLALLAIAVLLGLAWWWRQRWPLLALGLSWFFSAQLLTATVIPFELVYEHRNYFASLGVCIGLGHLLLLVPRQEGARRIGVLLAGLCVLAFATTTHLRAREWSDLHRFASSEAAKHPTSPRATYALGQTLSELSARGNDPILLQSAFEALERSRSLPRSNILPAQGLLVLAARTGHPQQDDWWDELTRKLRTRPIGAQETNALVTLAYCARDGECDFPQSRMVAAFAAAMANHPPTDVLVAYGDYALNVLGNQALALDLWRQVRASNPDVAQYRVNLAKLYIAMGDEQAARAEIDGLRALGRMHQFDSVAASLEQRLAKSIATASTPPADDRH